MRDDVWGEFERKENVYAEKVLFRNSLLRGIQCEGAVRRVGKGGWTSLPGKWSASDGGGDGEGGGGGGGGAADFTFVPHLSFSFL